jgi:hypothetical protein
MKKMVQIFTIIFTILLLSTTGLMLAESAKANPSSITDLARLIINSAGNVTAYSIIEDVQFSAKNLIAQNGTTYILMADLERYEVVIECSNIVFDGCGHSISTVFPGVQLDSVRNVSVKNVELTSNLGRGMMVLGSSNCQITGVNTSGDIFLEGCNNNIITRNTASFSIDQGSNNAIYQNKIVSRLRVNASGNIFYDNNIMFYVPPNVAGHNFWNNSDIGNYWNSYHGHGEYMIDKNNVDYHPLAEQANMASIAPTPPPFPPTSHYNLDNLVLITIVVILAVAVCVGLVVYFKKRKH